MKQNGKQFQRDEPCVSAHMRVENQNYDEFELPKGKREKESIFVPFILSESFF